MNELSRIKVTKGIMPIAEINVVLKRPTRNVGKNSAGRKSSPYFSTPVCHVSVENPPRTRQSIARSDSAAYRQPALNNDRLCLAAFTCFDAANLDRFLADRMQQMQRLLHVLTSNNDDHADTAIENAVHFAFVDMAFAL